MWRPGSKGEDRPARVVRRRRQRPCHEPWLALADRRPCRIASNRGIGGQDVEEMASRMRAEMQGNPASLVVWQTGTNAAIRHMPHDKFERWLRNGLTLGKSLGADFVLMNMQYVPAVVAAADKEV